MKIINFRCIENAGGLIATCDVEFAPLTVRGIKLFRKGDAGLFINEPAEAYEKDGERRYRKHVIITDEALRARLAEEIKQIYRSKVTSEPYVDHHPDDVPF